MLTWYNYVMQVLSHDTVANIREKMLGCVFDLLYRKPEQEKELLSQLVNKLGDPVRKVASKATLFILKLSKLDAQTIKTVGHS